MFDQVGSAEQQHAFSRQAIASSPTGFLLVVLYALRRIGVHDVAHIRSVDAHAKGDGRHDDVDALAKEIRLDGAPIWSGEARMIGGAAHALAPQRVSQLVDL